MGCTWITANCRLFFKVFVVVCMDKLKRIFPVEWQTIVIVKPIHLSFAHTVPQSERKKTTITFRLFYFIMTNYSKDQDTQASHKTTKNCCCFPHLIGFFLHQDPRIIYPWCSGFSEFHRKLVWNFLKSNKDCNLNIFVVIVFKFVSFVFQGPQKHRSQLILLDRYM